MEELDKRHRNKLLRKGSSTPAKTRIIGDTAVSTPPPGALKWSVDPNWKSPPQGMNWL